MSELSGSEFFGHEKRALLVYIPKTLWI